MNHKHNHKHECNYLLESLTYISAKPDPSVKTAMNMLLMTSFMNSIESIKEGRAYGFSYFQNYFQKKTEKYIKQLVSKRKPKMVLVCMIYYPDENEEVSTWAQ
eukprot:Pgem_evm1s17777